MTSAPALLAVDVGTSELKVGLFALDGRLVADASAGHPTDLDPATGRAEQDPRTWWAGLRAGIAEVVARAGATRVSGICVTGQGPTTVAVEADGTPVRPAVTWLDTRAVADAAALADATGTEGWSLGVTPAARMLERDEPVTASAVRWYLDSWDWVALRLTGRAAASRSPGQRMPDPVRVDRCGVPARRLPPRVGTGEVLGGLLPGVAAELGLPAGTPVVAGCVDAYASFHGAGMAEPGDAIDTGGTSGGLGVYGDRRLDVAGTFAVEGPLPGRWLYGGAMTATGRALEWLADDVLGGVAPDELVGEAAGIPAGAGGIVFLPYLAGERSPIWDPAARGVLYGLALEHGRGHVVRAVLEAAAFALRHVAEPIRDAGLPIRELRVSGGTARSRVWNQVKADVLGVTVAVPVVVDTALTGAAVVAAVGTGHAPGLVEAMRALVRIRERLTPDPSTADAYAAQYAVYRALYPATREVVGALHARLPGI